MKRYFSLLLIVLMISIPFLGRGLFESSEGRYAMVAKTMVESGDYWLPKINGHIHLTKPPLTYWIIALGQKIFGMTTFGTRIMHALLWTFTSLLMFRIGNLVTDGKKGFFIALVFCTSLLPALGSWFLTTDSILVSFQVVSFWALLEYRREKKDIWIYAFWSGLGLAFNTKGPVAFFPLIFWIMFFSRDLKTMCKPIPILIFIVVSTFWYMGLEITQPGTLIRLFQDEIIKRSTTDFSGRNAFWWAPLVTYLIPLIIGWGLWPFFITSQNSRNTFCSQKNTFYFFWIIGTFIIFSMIKSRLVLYILPLSVPFAILIGQMINEQSWKKALAFNLILIILFKTSATILPYDNNARQIAEFADKHVKADKVFFVNEYLYGVEFYMGPKFSRYSTVWGIFEALQKKEPVQWVAIQDKRMKMFNEMMKNFSKEIIPHSKSGKWNIFELRDKIEISGLNAGREIQHQ